MITLVSGTNTYNSYQKAKELLSWFAQTENLSPKILDADIITDPNFLLQEIEGVSMFDNGNIILAKRLLNNKKLTTFFSDNFESLNKYPIIIWQDSSADLRLKLVQRIKSKGGFLEFKEEREGEIKKWIADELAKRGISLSKDLIDYIFLHVGSDKFYLENEIEKIALFKKSGTVEITESVLNRLLGYETKGDIWKFLDYFGKRNKQKTIEEFLKLTSFEDNFQYIIAMIAREIRIFLTILFAKKNNLSFSELKINPFVLNKSSSKVSNFKEQELKLFSKKLLELDVAIKTGKIEEDIGLILFLNLV